jgi:glucuronate isomerase
MPADPAAPLFTGIRRNAVATSFMHEDFLLETERAKDLYHSFAASPPIIDYHCHLSPKDIAENRRFATMTEIWLAGDHYKWRAMRTCGVDERFITGNATDWEKFQAWSETVPKTLRNPLHHWTHLELWKPFGITDRLLGPSTAKSIWAECNAMLATPGFTTRGLQARMNVEVVCTTDDPADSLEFHSRIASDNGFKVRVYPAFRPDKAMTVDDPAAYVAYLKRLGEAAGTDIRSYAGLCDALARRHSFFHSKGCRVSDHGLETVSAEEYTTTEIESAFARLLRADRLTPADELKFKSALLHDLAVMDCEKGWVQQYHLGALRDNNTRLRRSLGPDTGFDSIGDWEQGKALAKFLNRLDERNELARTILYNLNPRDNELFASMAGNFQDGSVPGKIQYGAAWWFLDQRDGMTRQLEALSSMGMLSQFVGMITDSRSFLSYPRHEYFRRLLCNILGGEMTRGLIPDDREAVGAMVRAICYENAKKYFNFPAGAATAGEGTKVSRGAAVGGKQ